MHTQKQRQWIQLKSANINKAALKRCWDKISAYDEQKVTRLQYKRLEGKKCTHCHCPVIETPDGMSSYRWTEWNHLMVLKCRTAHSCVKCASFVRLRARARVETSCYSVFLVAFIVTLFFTAYTWQFFIFLPYWN